MACPAGGFFYSSRSTIIGSTEAARKTGSATAKKAVPVSASGARTSARGSKDAPSGASCEDEDGHGGEAGVAAEKAQGVAYVRDEPTSHGDLVREKQAGGGPGFAAQ